MLPKTPSHNKRKTKRKTRPKRVINEHDDSDSENDAPVSPCPTPCPAEHGTCAQAKTSGHTRAPPRPPARRHRRLPSARGESSG